MRLIYFIPLLSTKGGQERTLTDKANFLARQGHEVLFVTYEHDGPLAYQLPPRSDTPILIATISASIISPSGDALGHCCN